jgi:aryl-alcohol dehydrogenase-like predicted oxidoreductase
LLTGQIKRFEDLAEDDWRRASPRFLGENFVKNLELVTRLEEMALDKGCTAAQLAMAWVLAQGENIVPIPGTKRVKYLEDNIASAEIQLSASELDALESVVSGGVSGMRYPEALMGFVDL